MLAGLTHHMDVIAKRKLIYVRDANYVLAAESTVVIRNHAQEEPTLTNCQSCHFGNSGRRGLSSGGSEMMGANGRLNQ